MADELKPVEHWAVTVRVNGDDVLTIESNSLSGIPNIDDYDDIVRLCANHLLAFIGTGMPAQYLSPVSSSAAAPVSADRGLELEAAQNEAKRLGQLLAHVHWHLTNDENFNADELETDMRWSEAGKWIDLETLLIQERAECERLRALLPSQDAPPAPGIAELVSQARALARYYRKEKCTGCEGHCFECDTSRMLDRLATALSAQRQGDGE